MSLRDKVKNYDKKYGTGNFLTLEEGQNQVRILTEPELYDDVINGQPGGSFISYVIARDPENGDSLALLNLSKVVIRWLAEQEELGKFAGYPMPYDIMIFKQKSGGKSTYVSVAVDAANSPAIAPELQEKLNKAKPITEVAKVLAEKKAGNLLPKAKSPAEIVAIGAANTVSQKRAGAEMNAMFTALEKSINSAADEGKLDQAADMIKVCIANGSINAFEADLLRELMANKKAELTGVPKDDIDVEDIPF